MQNREEILEREALALGLPKRPRMQTYLDILGVIKSGTEGYNTIMFRAQVGQAGMKDYLQSLVAQGLLIASESPEGRRTFSVSKKGFAFLKRFDQKSGPDLLNKSP